MSEFLKFFVVGVLLSVGCQAASYGPYKGCDGFSEDRKFHVRIDPAPRENHVVVRVFFFDEDKYSLKSEFSLKAKPLGVVISNNGKKICVTDTYPVRMGGMSIVDTKSAESFSFSLEDIFGAAGVKMLSSNQFGIKWFDSVFFTNGEDGLDQLVVLTKNKKEKVLINRIDLKSEKIIK